MSINLNFISFVVYVLKLVSYKFINFFRGEYIALNAQYKPLNLGQGFPDFFPPDHVTNGLGTVANSRENPLIHQYTRGYVS